MKAIMISIKPKWCAKIMNGKKTIEVRKNKALASAIQKLINENGYADIYVYCTKGKPHLWLPYEYDCFELDEASQPYLSDKPIVDIDTKMNGKVVFKFRCYKIDCFQVDLSSVYYSPKDIEKTCLTEREIIDYILPNDSFQSEGYAIHINELEIFDKPKELSEFKTLKRAKATDCFACDVYQLTEMCIGKRCLLPKPLTKAPQNFCYVEVE